MVDKTVEASEVQVGIGFGADQRFSSFWDTLSIEDFLCQSRSSLQGIGLDGDLIVAVGNR